MFHEQNIQGMLERMHKFYVKPADTFLLEGGIPHAIGEGCFLVEIQKTTDYTIRIERISPSGLEIDDFMCHQGLVFEKMFDCFNYEGFTKEETAHKWHVSPSLLNESKESREVELIGY
ncbi:hypothetical protein JMM81_08375 [Bacillus sp. V3B]|uniref:hypothetical protein n=1 Tax=Bacillus sp. V3B TaxID=2804915 RepID=UPI00210DD97C|nr:hypothetical protein [Bacillus sp. V3B]MCQ6274975.1 hypothetical protein [Bacillus sp. V3B]